MSLKELCFLFIILNVNVLGISGKQCSSCVGWHWNDLRRFLSFMPKGYHFPSEDAFCNMTNECFLKTSQSGKKSCERSKIDVTFPVISGLSNTTLWKRLPKPVLVMKDEFPSTTSQILSALAQIWRLLVFCPMAAILSGVIIWFLVSITKFHLSQLIRISFTN